MNNFLTKTIATIPNNLFSSLTVNACRSLCYKSDLSLKTLYPNSNDKLITPSLPVNLTDNTKFSGFIPLKKLQITYSRSSGPGGQNVNCVDTKCDVRFHVASADWLSETTRSQILEKYKGRITKDGFYVLKNDRTRYQQMNLADSLETIRNMIREIEKPKPEGLSVLTKAKIQARIAKADRERIRIKREKSSVKADRRQSNIDL